MVIHSFDYSFDHAGSDCSVSQGQRLMIMTKALDARLNLKLGVVFVEEGKPEKTPKGQEKLKLIDIRTLLIMKGSGIEPATTTKI